MYLKPWKRIPYGTPCTDHAPRHNVQQPADDASTTNGQERKWRHVRDIFPAELQGSSDQVVPKAGKSMSEKGRVKKKGIVLFQPLNPGEIYEGKIRKIACPEWKAKKCT